MEAEAAGAVKGSPLLFGLREDAAVEDLEYLRADLVRTLSAVDSKRAALQAKIAEASRGRGKRRAPWRPAAAAGDVVPAPHLLPADDHGACYDYTRKGAGAVRRRLRAAAGDARKERERLEAAWDELQEALTDARERAAIRNC